MKKAIDNSEQKTLRHELTQGLELAKELFHNLHSTSSIENRDLLVAKLLSSYDRSLSIVKRVGTPVGNSKLRIKNSTLASPSSRCEIDISLKDLKQRNATVFKKRKTLTRCTKQVRVCSGTDQRGLNDSYSWRKYGQKDILGSNYPRGYYRCIHRKTQGCLATKQVQRSDQDTEILEVAYKGRHTCGQASKVLIESKEAQRREECEKMNQHQFQVHEGEQPKHYEPISITHHETEHLNMGENDILLPSFSFTSPIDISENHNTFSDLMIESNLMASFSPPFVSPATSEYNDLVSLSQFDRMNSFGVVQTPESDLTQEIPSSSSNQTSVSNSPIGGWDLILENHDFELHFLLDNPEFSPHI